MSRFADAPAPLGVREALGGEWGFNATHRAITLIPAAALVALQEAPNPAIGPALVALSAVLQQLVSALVSVPIAVAVRRSGRPLPVPLSFAVWAFLGGSRGVVGGCVAILAGLPPEFDERILFWLAIAWVWVPLLTYVLAQLPRRRELLGILAAAQLERDLASARAARTSEEIRGRVVEAIDATLTPAVDDIRRGLLGAGPADDGRLGAIGARLAELSAEVTLAVDTLSESAVRVDRREAGPLPPLTAALGFERSRPLLWAGATAAGIFAVTGSLAVHAGETGLVLQLAVAIASGATALAIAAHLYSPRPGRKRRRRWELIGRYVTAAATSAIVLGGLLGEDPPPFAVLLIAVLPLVLAYTAGLVSFTVGIARANEEILAALGRIEQELQSLEDKVAAEEDRIRGQLSALTHGPIQGRLAACAMALNFHAADDSPPERVDYITRAVLEHLDAVSADLAGLQDAVVTPARGAGHPDRRPAPAAH